MKPGGVLPENLGRGVRMGEEGCDEEVASSKKKQN